MDKNTQKNMTHNLESKNPTERRKLCHENLLAYVVLAISVLYWAAADDMNTSYIEKNILKLNIFFGKLHYTLTEEELAYGLMDAIGKLLSGM